MRDEFCILESCDIAADSAAQCADGRIWTSHNSVFGLDGLTSGRKGADCTAIHADREKLKIDLWYAPDGTWLALESMTEQGARLRYVLSG